MIDGIKAICGEGEKVLKGVPRSARTRRGKVAPRSLLGQWRKERPFPPRSAGGGGSGKRERLHLYV